MLLVIDVGNTQTAIGVYEGESLDRMWRVATNRDHTADELRVKLLPLLQSENLQASDITGAALASVVPQLTGAWTRAVQDLAGVRAVVCSAKTAGSLFDADYPNPREIGLGSRGRRRRGARAVRLSCHCRRLRHGDQHRGGR